MHSARALAVPGPAVQGPFKNKRCDMDHRPKRLRDLFNPPPDADAARPPSPLDTDGLIAEIAAGEEIGVEEIARQLRQGERRLWHSVEEELNDGRNR